MVCAWNVRGPSPKHDSMQFPTRLSVSSVLPSSKVASHASQAGTAVGRHVLFAMLAGVGCAADLWTKFAVFQWRGMPDHEQPSPIWWLWEGYIGIETALNTGALFGLGRGKSRRFALLFFRRLARHCLLAGLASGQRQPTADGHPGVASRGGVLGNLYDRLGLWSGQQIFAVRDWIRLSCGSYVGQTLTSRIRCWSAARCCWCGIRSNRPRPDS